MQEDHHVMMEVESGGMRLQAKQLQGSPATTSHQESHETDSLSELLEEPTLLIPRGQTFSLQKVKE